MKIIIVALGSQGDVNPLTGIGVALSQRGHDVTVLSNDYFKDHICKAGLRFYSVGNRDAYEEVTKTISTKKRVNKLASVLNKYYLPPIRPTYDYISTHYIKGETIVLAGILPFGAWLSHEKISVPLVTFQFSPFYFRSVERVPVGYWMLPSWAPQIYKEFYWRLVDANYDRHIFPTLNQFRKEIGLASEKPRFMKRRRDHVNKMIGLFPEWFAMPQKDWPHKTQCTGFPFFDGETINNETQERLQRFLEKGEKPIVFTQSTAIRNASYFFDISKEVCRKSRLRAIFLTPFPEQVSKNLPDNICYFNYIPLHLLLPYSAMLVSHGGIGTCAQALRAGIPHIVMPSANDQFDNAERIKELGAGDVIKPKRYKTDIVAKTIMELLQSETVRTRCQQYAVKIKQSDSIAETCQIIENL